MEGTPIKPSPHMCRGLGLKATVSLETMLGMTYGPWGFQRSREKTRRRNSEKCVTNLSESNMSHENASHWNLDSEVAAPENKNLLPRGDDAEPPGNSIKQLELELIFQNMLTKEHRIVNNGYFSYGVIL